MADDAAYEQLLARLDVVGRAGDTASARCPAHDDSKASLSLKQIEGMVLLICRAGCDTAAVVAAAGLEMRDLFDNRRGVDYRYDDGRVVHRKPNKDFPQSGNKTGTSLYRAAKVRDKVAAGGIVYVVEGEKDVHAVEAVGGVATCSPMGAGKARKFDWTPLAGATVRVVPDQDDPGQKHAADIVAILRELNANVTVVAPKVGKDAADHIAAGYGLDDLVLVESVIPDSGAELLEQLHALLCRYVIFPSAESADAVTLWVAATHAQPAWEHATRLVIKSPLKRCGKTRLQEIISETCHKPLRTTNISVAALVRSISVDDPPTLILDEADAVFATRRGERSESAEDLRGILNSGHSRGWPYIRYDAAARRSEECATFAMAVLGGIGDMPDTIEDRAVVISMRRRAPGETVSAFRRRRSIPPLQDLRARLAAWVQDQLDNLADTEPELPVEDRAADTWEPLAAIADAAGWDWPERARAACRALTGTAAPEDGTNGERLLADLRTVFEGTHFLYLGSIVDRLSEIEEAPWSDWYRGEPIGSRALAKLLKPYGIASRTGREGGTGESKRGYYADDFRDAWSRYVRDSGGTASLASQPSHDGQNGRSERVTEAVTDLFTGSVTAQDPTSDLHSGPDCDAVTGVTEDRLNGVPTCTVCGLSMSPWLVEHGYTTHVTCEPEEAA